MSIDFVWVVQRMVMAWPAGRRLPQQSLLLFMSGKGHNEVMSLSHSLFRSLVRDIDHAKAQLCKTHHHCRSLDV